MAFISGFVLYLKHSAASGVRAEVLSKLFLLLWVICGLLFWMRPI